jgi:hypothetical protein
MKRISHVEVEATRWGDSSLTPDALLLARDTLFKRNLLAVI